MWPETSNSINSKTFPDDDPPFFLRRNSSSGATNVDVEYESIKVTGKSHRETMLDEVDSTVRGIIDDLTVENKLLRARNKCYERRENYNKAVDKDKLFEVSLHNISPSDARDLEDILSAFVRSRNISNHDPTPQLSEANIQTKLAQSPGYQGLKPQDSVNTALPDSHATQSGASSNKHDSGYASMSMTSVSNLNNVKFPQRTANARKRSHFLDVPRGLLPTEIRATTERNKKKMVVQKLEELFTGKKSFFRRGSLASDHIVDQAAAQTQVSSAREGSREARIMAEGISARSKDIFADPSEQPETESGPDESAEHEQTPEQRPTRLLDLDPERQQIPLENVNYMRHLGISTPPNLQREDSQDAGPDAEGWVYLNLLMNLAQLHIMNVTADFVRDAIQEVSSKFQLSSDGRRLRWRGGTSTTQMSSVGGGTPTQQSSVDSESSEDRSDENIDKNTHRMVNHFHPKPKTTNITRDEIPTPRFVTNKGTARPTWKHASHYSPIFSHPSSENTDSSNSTAPISPEQKQKTINRKRIMTASIEHTPPTKKHKMSNDRHGGMVFYNDAPFFVDLSGSNHHSIRTVDDIYRYKDNSCNIKSILGSTGTRAETESGSESLNSQYLATRKYWDRLRLRDSILPSPDLEIPQELDDYFNYVPLAKIENKNVDASMPLLEFPIQMEASCLGCTTPADHFLKTVTSQLEVSTTHSLRNTDVSPLFQAESMSSSKSQSASKPPRGWKPDHEMELVWQRIEHRLINLRSMMKASRNTACRSPKRVAPSEDISSASLPNATMSSRAKPMVTRKNLNVTHRQLEPSPIPPPGLYLSDPSETSDYDSETRSSVGCPEKVDQSYPSSAHMSQNRQYILTRHGQFGAGITSSKKSSSNSGRRFDRENNNSTTEPSESSGVGEEEDEDDESIDMLGAAREVDPNGTSLIEKNWELERAREREMGLDDEIISVIVEGSPLPDSDNEKMSEAEDEICDS